MVHVGKLNVYQDQSRRPRIFKRNLVLDVIKSKQTLI